MGLTFHTKEEEPLMMATISEINAKLCDAQSNGLSLPGALNVMAHVITMVLVCSYNSRQTRERVASTIPDLVSAYMPQWEKIIADQQRSSLRSEAAAEAPISAESANPNPNTPPERAKGGE
jgi:hypothetical protein